MPWIYELTAFVLLTAIIDCTVGIILTPIDSIPSHHRTPNIKRIADMNLILNVNAASVHSALGSGNHVLLAFMVKPPVYTTQTGTIFIPPDKPGTNPVIPRNATGPQIAVSKERFQEDCRIWKEYIATGKVLKQQLLASVNEIYTKTLCQCNNIAATHPPLSNV